MNELFYFPAAAPFALIVWVAAPTPRGTRLKEAGMFRSILVPVDVEHDSSHVPVIPVAAELARDHSAVLHLLAVIPRFGSAFVSSFFPEELERKLSDRVKARLAELAAGANLEGIETKLHLVHGTIYDEILRAARNLSADLIVLAANRPEHGHYLLGPNAARVVRHADASVLVVRPPGSTESD